MRFAYADPPYPGCAHLYPEKTEVNHVDLVRHLASEYPDGWALSTGSAQLSKVLGICAVVYDCVGEVSVPYRVAAWVKPFANYKPNVNPAYAWEPVIWTGGRRKRDRSESTVADWVAASYTIRRGLVGAKPDGFFWWILDLLGARDEDTMDDLFPGTGRFAAILDAHKRQLRAHWTIPKRNGQSKISLADGGVMETKGGTEK